MHLLADWLMWTSFRVPNPWDEDGTLGNLRRREMGSSIPVVDAKRLARFVGKRLAPTHQDESSNAEVFSPLVFCNRLTP